MTDIHAEDSLLTRPVGDQARYRYTFIKTEIGSLADQNIGLWMNHASDRLFGLGLLAQVNLEADADDEAIATLCQLFHCVKEVGCRLQLLLLLSA